MAIVKNQNTFFVRRGGGGDSSHDVLHESISLINIIYILYFNLCGNF